MNNSSPKRPSKNVQDSLFGVGLLISLLGVTVLGENLRRFPKTSIFFGIVVLPVGLAVWIANEELFRILYAVPILALMLGIAPFGMIAAGISAVAIAMFFPGNEAFAILAGFIAMCIEINRANIGFPNKLSHLTIALLFSIPLLLNLTTSAKSVLPESTYCHLTTEKEVCIEKQVTKYLEENSTVIGNCNRSLDASKQCDSLVSDTISKFPEARGKVLREMCLNGWASACTDIFISGTEYERFMLSYDLEEKCKKSQSPVICDLHASAKLEEYRKRMNDPEFKERSYKQAFKAAAEGCAVRGSFSCFNLGVLKIQSRDPAGILDVKRGCDLGFTQACQTLEKVRKNWTKNMCPKGSCPPGYETSEILNQMANSDTK